MPPKGLEIRIGKDNLPVDQLIDLYNSVGWAVYTNEKNLPRLQDALSNSSYVVTAWKGNKLIGFARCLTDDLSILYIQDILINPAFQRQGIGRELLSNCLERYQHVRMKALITDDEEKQKRFYESLGFRNTKDLKKLKLNAYVLMEDLTLE
jgi:ribosomal protein S18 acetylase RimI-like enzyme